MSDSQQSLLHSKSAVFLLGLATAFICVGIAYRQIQGKSTVRAPRFVSIDNHKAVLPVVLSSETRSFERKHSSEIKVANLSDGPVELELAGKSCGCAKVDFGGVDLGLHGGRQLPPAGVCSVEVGFKSNRNDYSEASVLLHFRARGASDIQREKVTVSQAVLKDIEFTSAQRALYVGSHSTSGNVESTVVTLLARYRPSVDPPWSKEDITLQVPSNVSVELGEATIRENRDWQEIGEVVIPVTIHGVLRMAGEHNKRDLYRRQHLMAKGLRKGSKIAAAFPLYIAPDSHLEVPRVLRLGAVSVGKLGTRRFRIHSSDSTPFHITDVSVEPAGAFSIQTETPPGSLADAHWLVISGQWSTIGVKKAEVSIRTNLAEADEARVAISALVVE